MRTIKPLGQYRRDYRRVARGVHSGDLDNRIRAVTAMLAADEPLPRNLEDHPLIGKWRGCRDCHLWPDLVLVYRKPNDATLELVRLGSHSELGF